MDEKPTKRGGGAVVLLAPVVLLVILPMYYVLSVGPVVRMARSGQLSESWRSVLSIAYWPLEWTAENVPVVGPAIISYVEWWAPPQPPVLTAPSPTAPSPTPSTAPAPGGS